MPQWQELNYSLPWSNLKNPDTMVGTQLLNIMVRPQPQLSAHIVHSELPTARSDPNFNCAIEADNPSVCLHHPKSTPNCLFLKIFKFSGASLAGMTSFTLQDISYLGFIMTILISSACGRKLYPMLYT